MHLLSISLVRFAGENDDDGKIANDVCASIVRERDRENENECKK